MKKFHITKSFLVGVGALFLSVAVLLTGGALAKYITEYDDETTQVGSKEFYFESNYLKEAGHIYKLNPGTDSVEIELYNYENELRVSEVDTEYKITVSSTDTTFKINGVTAGEATVAAAKNTAVDSVVKLSNLKDGYDYDVSVTADGGYVKTLTATFKVASVESKFCFNVDNSDGEFVLLTVWMENLTGTVDITVPAGLIPDTTDPILKEKENYEDGKYKAFSFSDTQNFKTGQSPAHTYIFFKTEDYDAAQNFTVKTGERVAVESALP